MNKFQKEYIQSNIIDEEETLKAIKEVFLQARDDIQEKISNLMEEIELADEADIQSKVWQLQYQQALLKQIEDSVLNINDYDTIIAYLEKSYECGWYGVLYDLEKQGIPLILPINQKQMVYAIVNETKLSSGIYKKLGYDKKKLAKELNFEISRGIANGWSFDQMSRQIDRRFQIGYNRASLIARTEGHRAMSTASYYCQKDAEANGCKIIKQWDATLDGRTRESHRMVDGELRNVDEKFSNGLMYPHDPNGPASEVCNCRCALLQRAKYMLGQKDLDELKERAEYYKSLDENFNKKESFEDFERRLKKIEDEKNEIKNKRNLSR